MEIKFSRPASVPLPVVKLVRVMMLGPVVACIALFGRNLKVAQPVSAPGRHNVFKAVPWFIVVFFALAALRSLSLIPDGAIAPLQRVASLLTVLSMRHSVLAWTCALSVRSAARSPRR